MFQNLIQGTTGKTRRTARLNVETLEGRDLQSTLPVVVTPALQVDWPPPPFVHVSVLAPSAGPAIQINANAKDNSLNTAADASLLAGGKTDLSHAPHFHTTISRASGEEIPQ